jgi:hypothetical protein
MGNTYSIWLKYLLLGHIIVSLIVGLTLVLPFDLNPFYESFDPLLAATFFSFVLGSYFAYREFTWADISTYIKLVTIWSGFCLIATVISFGYRYHSSVVLLIPYFGISFLMFGAVLFFETYELSLKNELKSEEEVL